MTAPRPDATTSYELRVAEQLDEHWSTWFAEFSITHEEDGTTLRGAVADQSELHGLLARIRDLGLTLISVAPATLHDDHRTPTRTGENP